MAKVIRHTYPKEFSIGLLLLIFFLASFLSFEIFDVSWSEITEGGSIIVGMLLSGLTVVIMALVLWEEFLFPVRIKPTEDKVVFRNHFTKLKTQIMIYLLIPAILVFLYIKFPTSPVAFFIWSAVVVIAPAFGKLFSGINNHNDFLQLTNDAIEYKNNKEGGVFEVSEIRQIILVKDESSVLHKVKLQMKNQNEVVIDLDEMELEAYFETIEIFISSHYGELVK